MRKLRALALALIMATVSIAGCIGGDDSSDDSEDEITTEILDDWQVHFAATAADLPECYPDTLGRLYYVDDAAEFQACTPNGWQTVDISGPQGMAGQQGAAASFEEGCYNTHTGEKLTEEEVSNLGLHKAENLDMKAFCEGFVWEYEEPDGTDTPGYCYNELSNVSIQDLSGSGGDFVITDKSLCVAVEPMYNWYPGEEIDVYVCFNQFESKNYDFANELTCKSGEWLDEPEGAWCDTGDLGEDSVAWDAESQDICENFVWRFDDTEWTEVWAFDGLCESWWLNADGEWVLQEIWAPGLTEEFCKSFVWVEAEESTGYWECRNHANWEESVIYSFTAIDMAKCKSFKWQEGTSQSTPMNGINGISPLITSTSSDMCPNGGSTFNIGMDIDANGILDTTEIVTALDICNGKSGKDGRDGADGQDGADGLDGADGANGTDGQDGDHALAVTSTEPSGTNCADGGIKIEVGVDDNGNGVLDSSEVDYTQYVCNGGDGADGADGTNGSSSPNTMLTSISSPPATMGCTAGGRAIQQGLDNGDGGGTAQNGVLESGEIDYITTYCSKYAIWQATDINSGSGGSNIGSYMEVLVGDTIYFSAYEGNTGTELWAYDTSNHSTWQVIDHCSGTCSGNPGVYMTKLVGDTIYFDAGELWAHDTSNHSTWEVADIRPGNNPSRPGQYMSILVGDTLYFSAYDTSTYGMELWAHDTSNHSTWQVADINSGGGNSNPGEYMTRSIGDTIYFSADDGNSGHELWAHDTSNHSTWRVANISSGGGSDPGLYMALSVGDTLYFDADDGNDGRELWAHDISNQSTWQVADIRSGSSGSDLGDDMGVLVGDTIYFDADGGNDGTELWAHDTSNHSTWQVADIFSGSTSSSPGKYMAISVGDTLYFDAHGGDGRELWALDTSTLSTWQVIDIYIGSSSSNPGEEMCMLVDNGLYFRAGDSNGGEELWGLIFSEPGIVMIEHSITYN